MNPIFSRLVQRGSPFELADTVVDGIPSRFYPKGPQTVVQVYRKALTSKDQDFVVADNSRLSLRQIMEYARRFDATLRSQGLAGAGTRIGICMDNSIEWVIAFISVTSTNSVAVLLNPCGPDDQLALAIGEAQCHVVVVAEERATNLLRLGCTSQFISPLHVMAPQAASENSSLHTCVSGTGSEAAHWPVEHQDPHDTAVVAFTSGSSGRPKGVLLTHRNITTGMMNMMLGGALQATKTRGTGPVRPSGPQARPCSIVLSSLSHIGGFAQLLLMCHLGGKLVFMSRWNPVEAWNVVGREQARSITGLSPLTMNELLRALHSGIDTTSLMAISVNGAAIRPQLAEQITRMLPNVALNSGYGMTETSGSICVTSGGELQENPTSCGPILPSVEVQVLNEAGQPLPAGSVGEIWVRGAMVARGYCDHRPSSIQHGSILTGDVGSVDAFGNLHVLQRRDDALAFEALGVDAVELEQLVCEHLDVDEAAALLLGGDQAGQRLVIAVVCGPRDPDSLQETQRQLQALTAHMTIQAEFLFYDCLPKTSSGKFDQRKLRNMVQEHKRCVDSAG